MIWKPNVVVAAIVQRDAAFLVVEEHDGSGRLVINQPAGHLDPGETLVQGAIRETLEETGWHFEPQGLVGVYSYPKPQSEIMYLRFCFHGEALRHEPERPLDPEIQRVCWYTRAELLTREDMHRSPLVMRCIDDYLAGRRFPLDLIRNY